MSVLESMRSGTDSTFMQLVFIAVVVSFVGWGLGVNGDTTDTVAKVNGASITGIDFSRAYRDAEYMAERRSRTPMTQEQRDELRRTVFDDLIRREALLQEASNLGLEVSDREVANVLLDIQRFKDADGRFDARALENELRRRGLTRSGFEEDIREQLLLAKLESLMKLGASVSSPAVKRTYIEQNSKVDVEFVRMSAASFLKSIEPSEEELATWTASNPDAIKARYDRDFAKLYDVPAKVQLRMIRLAVRDDGLTASDLKPRLERVLETLEAGGDFDELARRWSEHQSAANGGLMSEQAISKLDPEVVSGIEGVEAGQLTKIVVGEADVRLFRVESRTEARVIPQSEVQPDLALQLYREEQAPVKVAEFAEKTLLPGWSAAGELPTEELTKYGLRADKTGLKPAVAQAGVPSFGRPPAELMKAAADAEVGVVLPEVYESGGTLWVGKLLQREDADLEKFDEEKAKYHEIALMQRRMDFYKGWEDQVVERSSVQRYLNY